LKIDKRNIKKEIQIEHVKNITKINIAAIIIKYKTEIVSAKYFSYILFTHYIYSGGTECVFYVILRNFTDVILRNFTKFYVILRKFTHFYDRQKKERKRVQIK
jgi:hypothetical protein